MVHIVEDFEADGVKVDPLSCVRKAVRGLLYADDAGIVPQSAEGLANMMTVIATVFEAAGSPFPKCKRRQAMLLRTPNRAPRIFTARRRSSGTEV